MDCRCDIMRLIRKLMVVGVVFSLGDISRFCSVQARSLTPAFGPEMGPEMLVNVLRTRGDNSAETNAHRIILSVHTASSFISDVLESAMFKTLQSAISSRENLFFSLQHMGNDSRRVFDLVDRATAVVSDTAKKAKTEINDAIKTSLDHLKESMKIIIRNLPDSKLSDANVASIIENGQYRMEVVVENSGQRIIDAVQSYRSHFIKIDKDTGTVMVDPESSQEATDAVKHIINAAKSQIHEAVAGSTSFILARIRDCLMRNGDTAVTTTTPTGVTGVTVAGNGSDTFQAEVITVSQMEDPQEDKLVVIGEMPSSQRPTSEAQTQTSSTVLTEAPMIINTLFTTVAAENVSVVANESDSTTVPSSSSTVKVEDAPKATESSSEATVSSSTSNANTVPVTSSDTTMVSTMINVVDPALETSTVAEQSSTATPVQGPAMRRRIPQIKPIVSGGVA